MRSVTFYEKPGCQGNARQKEILEAAGYTLTVKSILSEPWTRETLRPFFSNRPVAEWFNDKAPAVKSGEIDPFDFDENSALNLMLSLPILIRRPLIESEGRCCCGFDNLVLTMLGLGSDSVDLEVCQQITGRCD